MFWLKKAVSFWMMPLPLCAVLLVVGLLLARSERRRKRGIALASAGAALLLLLSNAFLSSRLLWSLESGFPAVPDFETMAGQSPVAQCRFVAVLGSGNSESPGMPALSRLSTSGLERIVEAVRILKTLPDARLIVSGPGRPGHPTHASVLADAARSLGVNPRRIMIVDTARDTEDEAYAVAMIAKGGRVALVTSAWHMARASRLFRNANVEFVPCPTDFDIGSNPPLDADVLRFDSEALEHSTLAVHEWLGILWLRLRGIG